MFVKICGLTTPEAVDAAVAAGADALGFVFSPSPRRLTPDAAHALCRTLSRDVVRVAVMRHPSVEEWERVRGGFAPDWLQTDHADLTMLDLGECEPLPVFRTGSEAGGHRWPERVLYESARSGSGEKADWQEAARIATRTRLILAGGLNGDNVAAAIRAVKPWGVDVSSGVEVSRGVKDPGRIADFIARVRAAG